MSEQYIQSTIADFFKKLDNIHDKLETFSGNLDIKRDNVFKELEKFESFSNDFKSIYQLKNKSLNSVEKRLMSMIDNIQGSIKQWHEEIAKNNKGVTFMHNHQKYLVVMIFGAVKAGKSTLGNFFAGQKFIEAAFDNEYKHRPHPEFATEEKGRDTGDIKKDIKGNAWFQEGVTDTTGDIQYFTLSGLRWMDSPGTGALKKAGDKVNMEEMVKEYISYTDLCIFLMNSSEPGLMSDMKYINKLSREEQEAIVVITKSDENEEDEDEDGNLIDVWKAKSPENRKIQEDDILARLHKAYPNIPTEKFKAISISTLLANLAIKDSDEKLYRDSQLDKLMKILGDKASDNVIALKERKPKQSINNFIDKIIDSEEDFKGILALDKELEETLSQIDKYKQKIEEQKDKLPKLVYQKVKNEVMKMARDWDSQVNSGSSIDSKSISRAILDKANPILRAEINKSLSYFIDNYRETQLKRMETVFNVGKLEKRYDIVTTDYTETYYEPRDPDGAIEHIRSWFGKKYIVKKTRTKSISQKVDLGTNVDASLENLLPVIEKYIKNETEKTLEDIRQNYFLPQEKYINEMRTELNKLQQRLINMKFDL